MRIVVTGGRHFRNRNWLWAGLDRLHELAEITQLIEGNAEGADRYAGEWADRNNIPHTIVPARWQTHGKSAGYVRNCEMADMEPDLVLAAPGGKGTAMMVDIARKRGIRVVLLEKMDVFRGEPSPAVPAQSHCLSGPDREASL